VFQLYAQVGAGLAIGRTKLRDQDDFVFSETHYGPAFTAGLGVQIGRHGWMPSVLGNMSFVVGYDLSYAPAISNNVGETHASGGHRITLGLGYER
jgi:hypothetical protein